MNGGIRRRSVFKVGAIAGLVGGLVLAVSLAASATTPGAGQTTSTNGFEFSNVLGYTPAGTGANCGAYAPGATFGFSVNVYNNSTVARDQRFNLQVFKMTDLSVSTCYTEAQLEGMVHNGQKASETQVVNVLTNGGNSYHFGAGQPIPASPDASQRVSASTSALTCGYFQFDLGLEGTGSFAPAPGNKASPVSGFILFNGAQCASSSGVSGTGVGSTTTTTTTALPNTGGGPAPLEAAAALWLLGLVSLIGGIRVAANRRT